MGIPWIEVACPYCECETEGMCEVCRGTGLMQTEDIELPDDDWQNDDDQPQQEKTSLFSKIFNNFVRNILIRVLLLYFLQNKL